MRKVFMFAAFVAASPAFIGCSSDESLSQQDTPVVEGTPLVVKLVDGDAATRGTDYTASTLPGFSLYSVKNGGTERWLGEYTDAGVSTGEVFTGSEGVFTSANAITWKSGAWDFYALSDASFATESDGDGGTRDAEHLNAASDRNFTYTVKTDYNGQKDLLVAAAMNQTSETNSGEVTLPFQHALAQIGQITFNFDASEITSDNDMFVLVIKSVTLHNINTTGTMTFPAAWSAEGFNGSWSNQSALGDYHIELPQFELDAAKNYKIFEEDVDDDDPFENEIKWFATGTQRGTDGPQNYFRAPKAGATASYVLPVAKKTGDEWDADESIYKAENATYSVDGGLYIIPQALPKTVWTKNNSGEVTGITSGVYAEIQCIMFNETTDPTGGPYNDDNPFLIDDTFAGAPTGNTPGTKMNNATMTQALNNPANYYSLYLPLTKATKELKGGKLYNLTFDLSNAVSLTTGFPVFEGITITE